MARLDAAARETSTSVTALVSTLLDEGLKARAFPGVIFRDGNGGGRNAGIVDGPEIWEIIRRIGEAPGPEEARVEIVADALGISRSLVSLAVDFYVAHPEEIDDRISAAAVTAAEMQMRAARRERLLGPVTGPATNEENATSPGARYHRETHREKRERTVRRTRWFEIGAVAMALTVGLYAFGVIGFDSDGATAVDNLAAIEASEIDGVVETEPEGIGPTEPDDAYFVMQRAGGPGGTLDEAKILSSREQARALAASGATGPNGPRDILNEWEHTGPTNIGGRIVDLVVDIDDPDTVYVASASGGVWKSTDRGVTMEYAWDYTFPQTTGGIAMGSNGRLWVGTGEHNPGGGSLTFPGNGIYYSDDRGETWVHAGLSHSVTTGRIWVHPTNPDIVFAAMSGSLFNARAQRGVYRTHNGGQSWRLVLEPETPMAGGIDLAIHPDEPDTIYAAMWDHQRTPEFRHYGGLGSGLFKSTDGGNRWRRLENVLTFSPGDATGLSASETLGRIGVAIAPTNPDKVYVITTATYGQDKGFYVSEDGGESFNAQTRPGSQGGFGWWFGRLWVDPTNENIVFAAGVNLRRTTNGGATWANVGGVHADQHAMQWATAVPNLVYLGNDGGTYASTNNGVSGSFVQAVYETYSQFYTIDVGELAPDRITAGLQDHGSWRSWTGQNPGDDTWQSYNGGDGLKTIVDPSNPNIYYGCSQYGSCVRRVDGPADGVTNATISSGTVSARRNWLTPIELDPNNPAILYYGGNVLNKSTNRGSSWTRISPESVDLTGTFEPGTWTPSMGYSNWGTITTISVSKTQPDLIYLGTDTGRLWKTPDGGATWIEFTGKGLPDVWVTNVTIDPENENTVYATFSGYRSGQNSAHVYKTTNGGDTWTNISSNLPNAPVNDLIIDHDNNTVYVATDVRVYYLRGTNWKPAGTNLPIVPVLDLRLHQPTNTLYAGTFGHGVFKLDLTTG